jgi:hypothetical protein
MYVYTYIYREREGGRVVERGRETAGMIEEELVQRGNQRVK